jgi:hypothetical protein
MNDKIDASLARLIAMKRSEIEQLDPATLTIAEQAAIRIIIDALDNGGNAMKLLVERVGGTAVQKNISINTSVRQESITDRLAALLGGSRKSIEAADADNYDNDDDTDDDYNANVEDDDTKVDDNDDGNDADTEHSTALSKTQTVDDGENSDVDQPPVPDAHHIIGFQQEN